MAEIAIFAAYLFSLVAAFLWAGYRIIVYLRNDREREQHLFDLMSSQDFKVYAERLKQEHDAKMALAAQEADRMDLEQVPTDAPGPSRSSPSGIKD